MRRTKEEKFLDENWDLMTKEEQYEVKSLLRKAFEKALNFINEKKEKNGK